jgi:hypothetical protein
MIPKNLIEKLEKIHRIQVVGIDLDLLFTFFISYFISKYFNYNFYIVFIIVIFISIFVHKSIGIKTRLNEELFY